MASHRRIASPASSVQTGPRLSMDAMRSLGSTLLRPGRSHPGNASEIRSPAWERKSCAQVAIAVSSLPFSTGEVSVSSHEQPTH